MRNRRGVVTAGTATLGAVLVGIGIVYLTVACENLPGILGPHSGDTSPRTPLGIVFVVLGLGVLALAVLVRRPRPPVVS